MDGEGEGLLVCWIGAAKNQLWEKTRLHLLQRFWAGRSGSVGCVGATGWVAPHFRQSLGGSLLEFRLVLAAHGLSGPYGSPAFCGANRRRQVISSGGNSQWGGLLSQALGAQGA